MTRTFGLDAPARLAALKSAVEQFRADYLNKDLAGECACKAWHLSEHVFGAVKDKIEFTKPGDFQEYVKNECPELAHLRVLCDAHKHTDSIRNTGDVEEADYHPGDFDPVDFCPKDFDVGRLKITLTDGNKVSVDNALDRALVFWSKFFKDHGIK